MNSVEATLAAIDALEAIGIPYVIVGALSVHVYGRPRDSKDADFVVQLDDQPIGEVARKMGVGFRLDPQASFERVTGTMSWKSSRQGLRSSCSS